jgi:hypothetical protein
MCVRCCTRLLLSTDNFAAVQRENRADYWVYFPVGGKPYEGWVYASHLLQPTPSDGRPLDLTPPPKKDFRDIGTPAEYQSEHSTTKMNGKFHGHDAL